MVRISFEFVYTGKGLASNFVHFDGDLSVSFKDVWKRTVGIHLPAFEMIGSEIRCFIKIMMVGAPFSKRTVYRNELCH